MANPEDMWQCQTVNCGYIYNPDKGDRKGKIPKGTKFEDLPHEWTCPVCGATTKCFRPLAGPGSALAECEMDTEDSSKPLTESPATDTNAGTQEENDMQKYVCTLCGYVYDPEVGDPDSGIAPGTKFEDIPDDWVCPVCGAGKEDFELES